MISPERTHHDPAGATRGADRFGQRLARMAREPLVHFLIAGALLFVVHAWLNRGADDGAASAQRTVRITANDVAWLKQTWARQWQRPPSDEELKGLVAGYLKETLLVREATLGLDENDTVVRRRLAQKMEFMVQDTAQLAEPGEEELRRLYDSQRERFQSVPRITFTHVYFNRDRRGARTQADARAALRRLARAETNATDLGESASGASVHRGPRLDPIGESASGVSVHRGPRLDPIGDRFLAQYYFKDADEQAVAGVFGQEFARKVFGLDAGKWQGPIESGYGLHLVRIAEKTAAHPIEFASARGELLSLWRRQREEQGREEYFGALLKKYDVIVDESVKPVVGPLTSAKELAR